MGVDNVADFWVERTLVKRVWLVRSVLTSWERAKGSLNAFDAQQHGLGDHCLERMGVP